MSIPREIADLHAIDELGPAFLGLQLFQLLSIIDHQGRELLDESGIDVPARTGSTIIYLRRHGPASKTDLARFLGMSHQLVGYRLKDLHSLGLLRETADPDDRRRTRIALSKKGREVAGQVERVLRKTENAFRTVFEEIGVELFDVLIAAKTALDERSLLQRIAADQKGSSQRRSRR